MDLYDYFRWIILDRLSEGNKTNKFVFAYVKYNLHLKRNYRIVWVIPLLFYMTRKNDINGLALSCSKYSTGYSFYRYR